MRNVWRVWGSYLEGVGILTRVCGRQYGGCLEAV